MWKRRTAWILMILSAAVMYFFSNETVTMGLLAALAAAPLVSCGIMVLTGRHLKFSLSNEGDIDNGHRVRITLHNPDILPVAETEVAVKCTNLRTGENDVIALNRPLPARKKREDTIDIAYGHAGRYEVTLDQIRLFDPLHLWSRKVTNDDKVTFTVMPELLDMQLIVTNSASSMPESERYADNQRGSDPGEVISIREYVPGDPVKNIHWKLSEKTGKMLVRELGKPVTDQFLVILDTAPDVGLNPDALDAIASVFASVNNSLLLDGFSFTVGWTDPETGDPIFRKAGNEADLVAVTEEYLGVPSTTRSAFETINRDITESRFAHLIMAGSRIPSGIDAITNGCQVTLLLYGMPVSTKTGDGASVIGFDENSYKTELLGIEV